MNSTPPAASTSSTSLSGTHKTKSRASSCAECRRLKLKCDRNWPCSSCRKRNCADLCPNGVSKGPGRASRQAAEIAALAGRVAELELSLREVGFSDRIPPPLQLEFLSKADEGEGGEEGFMSKDATPEFEPKETELAKTLEVQSGLRSIFEGVGSLSIREEDGKTRFLGTSAGSAYFDVRNENSDSSEDFENRTTVLPSPPSQIVRYPFIQLGNTYPSKQEIERLRGFLPSREEASRLAQVYWEYLSFMFESLEEDVFWKDYLPAAFEPHNGHGAKLACVFIILALGCLMDPRVPSTYNARSHHFFVLSQTALSASRFLSNNTLAAAQTLQLTANILLNTHNLYEGGETFFPILGIMLRLAVSMGLHRDGSKWGLSGKELDRRRLMFYEIMTIERMQAFISGRPYMLAPHHFDTQMPSNAPPYQIEKWKLGVFIGRVIDQAFSVAVPTYATVLKLDQEHRDQFEASPKELRSGALPIDAFIKRPTEVPVLPTLQNGTGTLKENMRKHTLDMVFAQVAFYLHKPAFAQALNFPDEPLASPWAASVLAISLETGVYMLAIAKSWVALHPVLCPRWWHPFFHAFAASVAQSSIVIKAPGSLLARHAWGQLNLAIEIFETASVGGAPCSMFVPRLQTLRNNAFIAIQTSTTVPHDLRHKDMSEFLEFLAEGTDASASMLGPSTRLDRKTKLKRPAQEPTSQEGADAYTPFDLPLLRLPTFAGTWHEGTVPCDNEAITYSGPTNPPSVLPQQPVYDSSMLYTPPTALPPPTLQFGMHSAHNPPPVPSHPLMQQPASSSYLQSHHTATNPPRLSSDLNRAYADWESSATSVDLPWVGQTASEVVGPESWMWYNSGSPT